MIKIYERRHGLCPNLKLKYLIVNLGKQFKFIICTLVET
jgi:hypothetical protein